MAVGPTRSYWPLRRRALLAQHAHDEDDTEVVPGALEALVAQVAEPGVAIAGPRLLFEDGAIQHAGVGFLRNALGVMAQHVFHHQDGMLPAGRGT